MNSASGDPVDAVRIEREGAQYSIFLRRSSGGLEVVRGATVTGGLFDLGGVLLHLLACGVSVDDAEHCIQHLEPDFDAQDEIRRRSETDMAAWRMADHLKREQLKTEFRRDRNQPPAG